MGEGWGEGLANTVNHPCFSTLRALTLALSQRKSEQKRAYRQFWRTDSREEHFARKSCTLEWLMRCLIQTTT